MKKPLIIFSLFSLLFAFSVTLFAQTTTGTSLITEMKAAVRNFTLASDLNSGQTGLQSSPVTGKKTGDILTAGEYNRLLELVGKGGGGVANTVKICRFVYKSQGYYRQNLLNSHVDTFSVGSGWTNETCRSYAISTEKELAAIK